MFWLLTFFTDKTHLFRFTIVEAKLIQTNKEKEILKKEITHTRVPSYFVIRLIHQFIDKKRLIIEIFLQT